jgi:hypothetical protein
MLRKKKYFDIFFKSQANKNATFKDKGEKVLAVFLL